MNRTSKNKRRSSNRTRRRTSYKRRQTLQKHSTKNKYRSASSKKRRIKDPLEDWGVTNKDKEISLSKIQFESSYSSIAPPVHRYLITTERGARVFIKYKLFKLPKFLPLGVQETKQLIITHVATHPTRTGAFTEVMDALINATNPDSVKIESVISEDMESWCRKNNYVDTNDGCFVKTFSSSGTTSKQTP